MLTHFLKKVLLIGIPVSVVAFMVIKQRQHQDTMALVAVANYGPHASLEASIQGMKLALKQKGFVENKNIRYEITDVAFNSALIPQMLSNLKGHKPRVMVVMTTPVAQLAKKTIQNIPLVFSAITDPQEAGLLQKPLQPEGNMTGASDRQDLTRFLSFAKKILPHARVVGVMYAAAEANDVALVRMLQEAAQKIGMEVMAVSIDQSQEIPMRMKQFQGKVHMIYVGVSGPIQPALPTIAAHADSMGIPVFNADSDAVKQHLVLGSFGVNYTQAGMGAGQLVARLLQGEPIARLAPVYPAAQAHEGYISKKKAQKLGIALPNHLNEITVVE